MARPPRSFHLQPINGASRARVSVPVEVQDKIGKKAFYSPVWRVPETEAAKLAWPHVQKFEAQIESARTGKFVPVVEREAPGHYGLPYRTSILAGYAMMPARAPSPN